MHFKRFKHELHYTSSLFKNNKGHIFVSSTSYQNVFAAKSFKTRGPPLKESDAQSFKTVDF